MNVTSYIASGMATGGIPNMTVSTNSTRKTDRVKRSSFAFKPKKQLNYNPREISSAILRASKAQSAGRIAVQAKGKLSSLLKCKGTGQYNERELNMAIVHARRMVRCAQMKTSNLRQEEQKRKRLEKQAKDELVQEKNEIKARAARKERNLEQKVKLKHIQRVQKQKSQKRELIRKKKFHRSRERSKLNEADMDYFRQQLRDLREPYSANDDTSGVTLELSMQGMQLTEAQIEQQIAQQMAAEMSSAEMSAGADGAGMGDAGVGTAMATGSGGGGMPATSFDILI